MPLNMAYVGLPAQPSRDALTCVRVAVLKQILPRRCSTMLVVKRNNAILVPHVHGRQIPKPSHSLTSPETLRTFVKESTISGYSASNAKEMLRIMTLGKGEACLTAGRRVQACTRPAGIQQLAYYLVEEAYYFRIVDGSIHREQGVLFIGVVAGRYAS